MFQTVFHRLSDGTLVGPLVALLVFLVVFFGQVFRIVKTPRREIAAMSMLPLDDAPGRRGEEIIQ